VATGCQQELLTMLRREATPGLDHDERNRGRLDAAHEIQQEREHRDRHAAILAHASLSPSTGRLQAIG
jgi:hypothetical protein